MGLKNLFRKRLNPYFNFNKRIGDLGELAALKYLLDKNYVLIDKNWRTSLGELDLICLDKNQYVFVEVKTRIDSKFAEQYIFSNISKKKKDKLNKLSRIYFKTKLKNENFVNLDKSFNVCRIDAIGIILQRDTFLPKKISHLANATIYKN